MLKTLFSRRPAVFNATVIGFAPETMRTAYAINFMSVACARADDFGRRGGL